MQHQFPELFVAHKQADLQREIEQNNLANEAINANKHIQQGWVANKMHDLSVWMIYTGERLHKRYHTPAHIHHLHQGSTQAR
jgi:hypothetical protein